MKVQRFLRESTAVRFLSGAAALERALSARLKPFGLAVLPSLILVSVYFEKGRPIRPRDLHAAFGTTKGNISHCLSRLEELHYLKRVPEPHDRRSCTVELTKKGEAVALRLVALFESLERRFEAALAPMAGMEWIGLLKKVSTVRKSI